MARSSTTIVLVTRLRPLGKLPNPACYSLTLLLVLACFGARTALGNAYPYPFMLFFLAIFASAFAFGRGSGLLAVAASAPLATYFVEPRGSFAIADAGYLLALAIFVLVGVGVTLLIEAVRAAVEELAASNERLADAQARLEAASEYREMLLRNVSHRAKNSFQAISGVLYAGMREVKDPTAQDTLATASRRLTVLARLHERLRVDKGAAVLNTKEFVEGLCADLNESLIGQKSVALRAAADAAEMDFDRAVALGLVVHEAVTQALKHAFPDERPGTVVVRFALEGDTGRLAVAHDGVGAIVGEQRLDTSRRLIDALAAQLGGRPEWSGSSGATLNLHFPMAGAAHLDAFDKAIPDLRTPADSAPPATRHAEPLPAAHRTAAGRRAA